MLEPPGLLAVPLVHLNLEVDGLILICETQRRQRSNLVVRKLGPVRDRTSSKVLKDIRVMLSLLETLLDLHLVPILLTIVNEWPRDL